MRNALRAAASTKTFRKSAIELLAEQQCNLSLHILLLLQIGRLRNKQPFTVFLVIHEAQMIAERPLLDHPQVVGHQSFQNIAVRPEHLRFLKAVVADEIWLELDVFTGLVVNKSPNIHQNAAYFGKLIDPPGLQVGNGFQTVDCTMPLRVWVLNLLGRGFN